MKSMFPERGYAATALSLCAKKTHPRVSFLKKRVGGRKHPYGQPRGAFPQKNSLESFNFEKGQDSLSRAVSLWIICKKTKHLYML